MSSLTTSVTPEVRFRGARGRGGVVVPLRRPGAGLPGAGLPAAGSSPRGAGSARAGVPTPLRLTRRGRAVLTVLAAAALLVSVLTGVLLLGGTAEAGDRAEAVPVTYRTVLPGETLWGIAEEVAPSEDPRDVVLRILELNALPDAGVRAGTRLAVPASTHG